MDARWLEARWWGGVACALSGVASLMNLACASEPRPLGTFEWEEYETRAVTTPMPVAPPPMQGDHLLDLSLREIGATRTSGREVASHPETGVHPLRTDGALNVRINEFFGVRVLGSLAYGSPIERGYPTPRPVAAYPDRASSSGGLGAVLGYWADSAWSITLALDGLLTLLDNRDRYITWRGPCFEYDRIFGSSISCRPETQVGAPSFQGMLIAPSGGATLDVSGFPLPWLRLGGGASIQALVSRGTSGNVRYDPVGIARIFVELHFMDVWLGLEAQQWVVENVQFAPALAVTIGGVALERPPPSHHDDDAEEEARDEVRDEAEDIAALVQSSPGISPEQLLAPTAPPRLIPWVEGRRR